MRYSLSLSSLVAGGATWFALGYGDEILETPTLPLSVYRMCVVVSYEYEYE